ncbi:cell surface protein SprA [Myroides gitamensis]|uniref:T9SS outer membrane translocon Sov/SprA n=1 Tax=Myroides odoratus TaxID=256 RepID=UPI00247E1B94|nr:cell surface protein SprA [Myroides gitamensis]
MGGFFVFHRKLAFCLLFVLCSTWSGLAQNNALNQPNDSIPQPAYDMGNIALPDPEIIKESYSYDPLTDQYYYTKVVSDFNLSLPLILSRQEYEKILMRAEMRRYFSQKFNAVNGTLEDPAAQRDMLPRYYVNSKLFSGIFGSNEIDVKPTGSVEFDMGIRHTKQENPLMSSRNRKSTTFDFDQRISMGLQGMVGTRLAVNANYDTQASFDFQNIMKLEYAPDEDDIVQKVEVGNVSMPISGSLIRGAQSLFGVKTELKFGKTTITGVFSEQKSQTTSVNAEGGGMLEDFELYALDYDEDRHFFLSQYFRSKYDEALKNYPYINSRVRITRVEVWVTNRYNRVSQTNNNLRNIVAIQDLGEGFLRNVKSEKIFSPRVDPAAFVLNKIIDAPTDNKNNQYDPGKIGSNYLTPSIRTPGIGGSGFTNSVQEGLDYARLESARKLSPNEFTFHPQLGYISLQQRLSNDEVLAVAFQYTIGDKVYQVGEFGTDGGSSNVETNIPGQTDPDAQVPLAQALVVKMLKSSLTLTSAPVWNLMMKNIYQIPNAMNISQDKFRFNLLYTDPSPLNYISQAGDLPLPEGVDRTPLLKVFHLDRLDSSNNPQNGGDGFFDYLAQGSATNGLDPATGSFGNNNNNNGYGGNNSYGGGYGNNSNQNQYNNNIFDGITIDAVNGRIIFTTAEPFGTHLFDKLKNKMDEDYDVSASYNSNQKKYVFRELYSNTKSSAIRNQSSKNKFQLKGKYSSVSGQGIPIGAFNIAPGSVVVNAGGRVLAEGVDYTVDYTGGRVMILDEALLASNTPINISVENNTMFGQQTKRFFGLNIDHQFSKDFKIGGTFLRLSEKPMTHKSVYGQESVNNTIWGFNMQYSTEVPFLTRMVNKLPNIDTDVESRVSVRGEFAYLQPGASKNDQMNGEATVYIDDFEGAQSRIDIRSPLAWKLSSTPVGFFKKDANTYEDPNNLPHSLEDGFRRGKLAWYTIDPTFYVGAKPNGVGIEDMSSNRTRRIYSEELFATKDIAYGESRVITTLDMSFYPEERGPYNFNPDYLQSLKSKTPRKNWGGVMRGLATTNFEQANIEFVEFWVLDPYVGRSNDMLPERNSGELRLNFGFISEDILRDGYKQYENGLPGVGSTVATIETIWGKVPAAPSLIYAFDVNAESRRLQDVGLDGLSDEEERIKFADFAGFSDPAADNFVHYLDAEGSILERYKNYNGLEGNSPTTGTRGGNNQPDAEDIDGDNTMNTIDAYFEYAVKIKANPEVGENYVTDIRNTTAQLADGSVTPVRWVQYKVPIDENGKKIGMIDDFRSMRFMRMYLTGFESDITLRFGSLDLVRSDWRRYNASLQNDKDNNPLPLRPNTGFDVTSVSVQDNYDRKPIPYVIPPGVKREQYYVNNTVVAQNEQSLSLKVYPIETGKAPDGLAPGDSRGVYKNFNLDLRRYNKLRMFIHAEALENSTMRLRDDEMVAFIRLGTDITDNFYQVEIPLKVTNFGEANPDLIWPEANELELKLELLTKLKVMFMNEVGKQERLTDIFFKEEEELSGGASRENKLRYGIKGNPNFGNVRVIMIGLRNDLDRYGATGDLAGEFWFDELRMSDMDNKGGWAATLSVDANLADFANISATGTKRTIGFGGLEQGPNQRSKEDFKSYSIVTNVNLGQLLPKNWRINLPFNYAISEEFITPEFDPANPDVKLKTMKSVAGSSAMADEIEKRATDYTKRRSINFIGVNKQKDPESKKRIYDIENITLSHSYNEVIHHDFEVESMIDQQTRSALDYAYSFEVKPIEPFKKMEFMKGRYWQILKDFNFNYLPSNIMFSSNIMRQYNKQQFRLIDVEGIGLDPLYRRNYYFNYNYGFNFDLTKSLRLNYVGGSNNIVRNYYDSQFNVIENSTIWDDYFNVGEPNQFTQQFTLNYDLPLNKIPFLAFVRSSYAYTGTYNWQRASDAFREIEFDGVNYNLGNTIQNSRTQQLNTTFSLETLYRYVGLVKRNTAKKTPAKKAAIVPGQKVVQEKEKEGGSTGGALTDFAIGLLTSVKTIQINYSENSGTVLPGFMPSVGFFGTSKPTMGFVFGDQADVRYQAASHGYLTNFPEFNQEYTEVSNKTLNFTASVNPIPDLTIDVTGRRMKSENYAEQFQVLNNEYQSQSPYNYGNFSISTIMLSSAFSSNSLEYSAAFERMKENRLIVANRLATARGIDINNPANLDKEGFPVGYSKGSQEVLLPSFLAAYTGKGADKVSTSMFRDIPLPNWNLRYTGLMRIPWIKSKFRRFSIHHGYTATYALGSFSSNFEYYEKPNEVNQYGNYPAQTVVNNAILTEQFNPLIRFDLETNSAIKILAEIRKDRTLALSFDNNLLTETSGNDYVIGLGYRIKNVGFNSMYANNGMGGRIESDINIKVDLTLSKRETIVRYLDYNNNQVGGGQDMWKLLITADYMLSKNLTAIFFYDHSFSKAVISTMYPITNIRTGLTMRYSFGN